MANRSKPPKTIETAVLTQSRRKCCLCFFLDGDPARKKGQLAHLDRDHENNLFDNLAFLCFDHHDEYDGKTSQSKAITEDELRQHRDHLYVVIAEQDRRPSAESEKPRDIIPFPIFETRTGNRSTVLNAAGDINYQPKIIRKNIVQPGPEHLSEPQAKEIRARVFELAQLEAQSGKKLNVAKWYNRLYEKFQITSYHLIAATSFDDVISWLRQQAGLLQPKLRRTNNPAWRKSLYTGIWARSNQVGMSKEDVYALAGTLLGMKSPPESLTVLVERQLKRLHDTLFRRTRA